MINRNKYVPCLLLLIESNLYYGYKANRTRKRKKNGGHIAEEKLIQNCRIHKVMRNCATPAEQWSGRRKNDKVTCSAKKFSPGT